VTPSVSAEVDLFDFNRPKKYPVGNKQARPMARLSRVLLAAGSNRNAVNYWREAGLLTTSLQETSAGIARNFSRANALEIAFMAALTAAGASPKESSELTRVLLALDQSGQLKPLGRLQRSKDKVDGLENIDIDEFQEILNSLEGSVNFDSDNIDEFEEYPLGSVVHSMINLRLIVRRVDRLFREETST
jgi:hypothetical protein